MSTHIIPAIVVRADNITNDIIMNNVNNANNDNKNNNNNNNGGETVHIINKDIGNETVRVVNAVSATQMYPQHDLQQLQTNYVYLLSNIFLYFVLFYLLLLLICYLLLY